MYKFVDTIQQGSIEPPVMSEAFYLYSKNKTVDELVDGFLTLRVKGINELQQEVNAQELVGDGAYLLASRLPQREIEVQFLLKSNDAQELVQKQTLINNLLYRGLIKFTFRTMLDYYYEGVVSSIEYEEGTLNPTGTISITCPSPYRFKNSTVSLANGATLDTSNLGVGTEFKPESLEITTDSTSEIKITVSNGKQVKLLANTKSGTKKYKLSFTKGYLTDNGVTANQFIDISSNISDFTMQKGDSFTISGATSATLKFRAKEVG